MHGHKLLTIHALLAQGMENVLLLLTIQFYIQCTT